MKFHPLSSTILGHLVPRELPVVGVPIRIKLCVLSTLVVATIIAKPNIVTLEIRKVKFWINFNQSFDGKQWQRTTLHSHALLLSWKCFERLPLPPAWKPGSLDVVRVEACSAKVVVYFQRKETCAGQKGLCLVVLWWIEGMISKGKHIAVSCPLYVGWYMITT